jgi:aromatic-L-amino-acid decarboxylase
MGLKPCFHEYRAVKLWMVMRLYGVSGLQSHIRNHISIAKHFESLVRADFRFEMIVPTIFSLVCFRLRTPAGSKDNSRTLNSKLVEALNRKGDVLVTHTVSSKYVSWFRKLAIDEVMEGLLREILKTKVSGHNESIGHMR